MNRRIISLLMVTLLMVTGMLAGCGVGKGNIGSGGTDDDRLLNVGALRLTGVNQAPIVDAKSKSKNKMMAPAPANSAILDGTVIDDGMPNPPAMVTTTWSKVSGVGNVEFADASAVDTTALFFISGVYVLRLTANDGQLQSSDEIVITVNPILPSNQPPGTGAGSDQTVTLVNTAPVANAGPDQGVLTGSLVALNGNSSTDIDGDTLTYSWLFTAVPPGSTATLSSATVVNPTFTADIAGSYIVQLTVNDNTVNGVADSVMITVTDPPAGPTPPAAPVLSLTFGIKELQFNWLDVANETSYKLMENPDGTGFVQAGTDLATGVTSAGITIPVHLHNWTASSYRVSACNAAGCTDSNTVSTTIGNALSSIGYLKASNTASLDEFGLAVSLSGDGNTLAVGAEWEDSAATGINGNQSDNTALNAGAVYLFTRTGGVWSQQAYIKASNTDAGDSFGGSVSLSEDGNILAVGANDEASAATGVGGIETDNNATSSGAVYIFTRTGAAWTQNSYIKASNTGAGDWFGGTVSLSSDGNTLAVGAEQEDSNATVINAPIGAPGDTGTQSNNALLSSGAVYVFVRDLATNTWSQQAYVKPSNAGIGDVFGSTLSLSGNGDTLAVGAEMERSMGTGVNSGLQNNNSFPSAGAAYVFTRTGTTWTPQAYIKASNTAPATFFGVSISLSSDGNTLAVGSEEEGSSATGINGNQADTSAPSAGAAYLFTRTLTTWSQDAYIKASNTEAFDFFGSSVRLSGDGHTLAVVASEEDSAATGINGDQLSNTALTSGAVFTFTHVGGVWSQKSYVKASNTEPADLFGASISLSTDGKTLAVGAVGDVSGESSAATGINGNQSDNSAPAAGAVYLY